MKKINNSFLLLYIIRIINIIEVAIALYWYAFDYT